MIQILFFCKDNQTGDKTRECSTKNINKISNIKSIFKSSGDFYPKENLVEARWNADEEKDE